MTAETGSRHIDTGSTPVHPIDAVTINLAGLAPREAVRRFTSDLSAAAAAVQENPGHSVDMSVPFKGVASATVASSLTGRRGISIDTSLTELPEGAYRQITYLIPGLPGLYCLTTIYSNPSTIKGSMADNGTARRIVSADKLPPTTQLAFPKK